MRPACTGHPIFGRARCEEIAPPVVVTDARPKWVIGKENPAGAQERLRSLVGSFPEARLVLGEVTEALCAAGNRTSSEIDVGVAQRIQILYPLHMCEYIWTSNICW